MKKNITMILVMAVSLLLAKISHAQIDLVPGINYSYNPPGSNCIITNITVDVANNDNGNAGPFDVAMYLYDPSSTNYWIIGQTTLTNGLSGNSVITISNWNIDITQTSGIPSGTYRLGLWVDNNNAISETDENNNAGLLSGNINYSCGSAAVHNVSQFIQNVSNFPNPFSTYTTIDYTLMQNSKVLMEVYDVTGKKIAFIEDAQKSAGNYSVDWNCGELEAGIYLLKITVDGVAETKRMVVMK
jgi:hypothetical protein